MASVRMALWSKQLGATPSSPMIQRASNAFIRSLNSTSIPYSQNRVSPKHGPMSENAIKEAKDELWYNTSRNKRPNAPDKALQVFERLLDEERSSKKRILERGIVMNVLSACSKQGMKYDNSVERIERILLILRNEEELWEENIPSFVLGAVAKSHSHEAPLRAEALLFEMIQNHKESPETDKGPNEMNYSVVLNTFGKHDMTSQAEKLLRHLQDEYDSGNLEHGPNIVSYNCVLNALAHSKDTNAPQRGEDLINRMEADPKLQPDVVTYSTMLNCYAKRGMITRAEKLLQRLHRRYEVEQENLPNTLMYNSVMKAYSRSNAQGVTQRAENLLNNMIAMYNAGKTWAQPDRVTGNCLLNCYARRGMVGKAYDFLQKMHNLHQDGVFKEGPNASDYNTLMHALVRSNQKNSPEKAEALLNLMLEMVEAGYDRARPDLLTYSSLLHCYASRGQAKKAIELLDQMHQLFDEGAIHNGPDVRCYNMAMNALAKSNDQDAFEAAKRLLYRMQLYAADFPSIRPNEITFNSLLNCCSNVGLPAEAIDLLKDMEYLREEGELHHGPDAISYRIVIHCLLKSGEHENIIQSQAYLSQMLDVGIQPEFDTYMAVLNGYSKEGMAKEAEQLLQIMNTLNDEKILKGRPNSSTYNMVLRALAKCKEWNAPERANNILTQMRNMSAEGYSHLLPTVSTYNSILTIYANEGILRESVELLVHMCELHEIGDLKNGPDIASFNCVMKILAEKGGDSAPQRATLLLQKMLDLCASGSKELKPDSTIRESVLICFEKNGKLEEGKQLLQSMGIEPYTLEEGRNKWKQLLK